jgi:transketolase
MQAAIIPAILPSSRRELEEVLRRLSRLPHIAFVQIDVVDGAFASPASWPYAQGQDVPDTIPALEGHCFDADLMVEDPERAVEAWLTLGAARVTLHLESLKDPARTLALIKGRYGHDREAGPCPFELGLAVNVATDLALLEPHLPRVDYVQLMGIDTIGRQGEPFDPVVLERVQKLREAHPRLVIQVDGGVTPETAPRLLAAGASRLVVGHAITGAPDPGEALARFETSTPPAHESSHYSSGLPLTDTEVEALAQMANEIRQTIVEMLIAAGSGHTAGPLGMADIFSALYFHILRHDPKNPEWGERDRLILSNGHIVPVRYAAMAHAGYLPVEECLSLRKFGTRLQGHPERSRLPGLETTSGPLGEGLAQAAGMAYALRMPMSDVVRPTSDVGRTTSYMLGKPRVYCVMSDGEQAEGNTWEAAMFSGKYKLANLTAIMDRNNIQIDGMTEEVMPLEPVADKYRAFNWHVLEVNGNDIAAFITAVEEAKAIYEKPTIIIAHTIPGKGVAEIEFDYRWHGVPPGAGPEDVWKKSEQGRAMLRELRTLGGRISHDYA